MVVLQCGQLLVDFDSLNYKSFNGSLNLYPTTMLKTTAGYPKLYDW